MSDATAGFTSIDAYIASASAELRPLLEAMRATIREAAPEATEKVSYQMPTFALHGNLVHFAAYDTHIGFYPTPSGISAFEAELAPYKHAKGSVQFPIDQPLPLDLVTRMVRFRVEENMAKAAAKKKR
jgi:uncharacterized protein YdhG (YjbR/CyaY superfamily)